MTSGKLDEVSQLVKQMDHYYALGRHEEVLEIVQAIYRLEPEHDYAMYLEAWSLCSLERYQESISRGQAALARKPNHTAVMTLCVVVHRVLGQYAEALRLAHSAVELEPNDPDLLEELACTKLMAMEAKYGMDAYRSRSNPAFIPEYKENLDACIDLLEQAVELAPDKTSPFILLGTVYCRLMLYDEAEESYRAALELDSQNLEALRKYGEFVYLQGRQHEAQQLMETILMLDSKDETALYNLQRYKENESIYLRNRILQHQTAVRLYPQSIPHRLELIKLMIRDSHTHTLRELAAYLMINPGDMEMSVAYGKLLYEKKEYKKAIAHFEACREKDPANPFILSWLQTLSKIKKSTIVMQATIGWPFRLLGKVLFYGICFPIYCVVLLFLLPIRKVKKIAAERSGSPHAAAGNSRSGHGSK